MGTRIKTGTLSAMDVAGYIIVAFYGKDKEVDEGISEGVSNLKLQKLLYFCQAFSLAKLNRQMFGENLYAWKYGPVVGEVYEKYKMYKNDPLSDQEAEHYAAGVPEADRKIIDEVLEMFGGYSAIRLMEITHSHKPWKDLKKRVEKGERDVVISQEAIQKYYKPILSGEYVSNQS
ncbi:MAG: DUF4065 domain-containing protein [Candidatus Kaiserbacteria bacterium]|nr:DUF4065 domain-containing protein [Candidatus Kaiserbacteria bacterium]